MPPILALFGSYVFIAWVYRSDARNNPYPSAVLWLPILWMMRCASRSVDVWIGGGFGVSDRWDPVYIGVLLVLGLLALARRPCNWGQIFAHNSAVFFFYGYIILSLTWSTAVDNPAIKMLRPAGDLVMALIVVTEPNPRAAIITLFRRTAILLIPLSIVLIKYYPAMGRMTDKHWGTDSWIGVTTHKNPLGQLCLMAAMGFIWYLAEARRLGQLLKRQRVAWIYLALTAYLLFGGDENSRSSTSIFCLIMAITLFLGFGYMRDRIQMVLRRIVQGAVALAVVALVLQMAGTSLQGVVAELYGKDATLSDRTYLWADVMRLGMKSPVLGSGYGGFWIPSIYPQLSPIVDNAPAEAHNGYLETFANLGLLGVGLLAAFIIQSINSAANMIRTDFEYGRMRLTLLFTVVVMNYSEATFPRSNHLWWFGFLVFAVYARPWVHWPEMAAASGVSVSVEVTPVGDEVPI